MSKWWTKKKWGNVYGKVREAKEVTLRNGDATGNDRVLLINYETMALIRIKICVIHWFTKKKGRDKPDRRVKDIESSVEK